MEKIDFMQELYKIMLTWIRKQTDTVILLSCALAVLWYFGMDRITRQEVKIEQLTEEVRICDKERERLKVQVDFMQFRLEARFPGLNLDRSEN